MTDIPIKIFKHTLFPSSRLKDLPTRKKLSIYARRFKYEIKVNDEKQDMKFTIKGFTGKEIDFRVSKGPVSWGDHEIKDEPPTRWFVYEKNSDSLAFSDPEMENCICSFLYILSNTGKRETIRRILQNKHR